VEAERKRERERYGALAQRGAVRWHVGGAAAAWLRHTWAAHCRAIVEDGGVGAMQATWRTGGPGRDGGVIVSGWVRHGEAVGTALTGGVGSTVRPIQFSNQIKLISNGFKFAPNFA
jgi:hypothetical protein